MAAKKSKQDFAKCELCGGDITSVAYDSPVFCDRCISEMESQDLSPRRYRMQKELEETLAKPKARKEK